MIPGAAIGLLRIPAFGDKYEIPILNGTDLAILSKGVGHYSSTAQPGQIGNFAVAGHRVTHGQPFSRMLELGKGDKIIVETRQAVYTYVLDESPKQLTVKDTDTWVIDPVPGKPDTKPTATADHPHHLPGPLPLPGPLDRLRPSAVDPEQVAGDPTPDPGHLPHDVAAYRGKFRTVGVGLTRTVQNRHRGRSAGWSGSRRSGESAGQAWTRVPIMSELPVVDDTAMLIDQIKALAVVHGEVTLSSGRTADYYVDMRRVTLDGLTAPIIGRVML